MKYSRIAVADESGAKRVVTMLIDARSGFYFEPMPADRREFTAESAAIERVRSLAALDDGHPRITVGVEVGGRMQVRVWVDGSFCVRAAYELIVRSQRFSFCFDEVEEYFGAFSVAIENLDVFDGITARVRVSPR